MGIRNQRKQELNRLLTKSLDHRFKQIIQEGLNCSAFESEAVLSAVKEVYFPYLEENAGKAPPGKVTLVVVSVEEPAGKPISECEKVTVCLTIHRGAQDDELLWRKGPQGFRRARIRDLCQEALSQGGLLTREDLAYRIFFVTPRTITRDLSFLRKDKPAEPIPIRSMVQDIGPVLTHRVQIIELALKGKTTTEICRIMHHCPEAVANYLSTFIRCAHLVEKNMELGQIAFLLRRGKGLIEKYVQLLKVCEKDRNMKYHLGEMLQISKNYEKKTVTGKRHAL